MTTTTFRDTTDRRWQADVSRDALARVAAAGPPLPAVALMRIIREDMTIDAGVLAVHHRAHFAMVEPQAAERGVGLAVFVKVMDVPAVGAAWDAVIVGLRRRGLWPTEPVV